MSRKSAYLMKFTLTKLSNSQPLKTQPKLAITALYIKVLSIKLYILDVFVEISQRHGTCKIQKKKEIVAAALVCIRG